jgi:arylsulfatase A-like enzyme
MSPLLVVLSFALTTAVPSQRPSGRERPNIVLVLADDLGYGDPGCYNADSKIKTPNIDALARQGTRFVDAHSPSAVCSPTRYGLLTGRYAWRTALKKLVLWPWDGPLIEAQRLTLGSMLQSVGYHTACIGKWHLGWTWWDAQGQALEVNAEIPIGKWDPQRRLPWAARIDFSQPVRGGPIEYGFNDYFGDDVPNFPPYCWIKDDRLLGIPDRSKPEDMFGAEGPMVEGWDLTGVMPELTRRAVKYIEGRAKKDEPFFLYLPLTAPHTPIAPTMEFAGKSAAGLYGDWVQEVDWSLGEVMAALARHDLEENTLLVFTSDNGSPARDGTNMAGPKGSVQRFGHNPSGPFRGMKADIWEGGHRVPFIVRWPGRVTAERTSQEPIVLTDLMRTVAAIVGYELPVAAAEDSYDLGPAFFGKQGPGPLRDHMIHHSHSGLFAIRVGDLKLILGKGSGGFTKFAPPADAPAGQLYDLAADPGETENLWQDRPEVVERLSGLLHDYRTADQTYAPLLSGHD